MRTLQYPEKAATSTELLHVWNNAAFDGEELQGFSFPMKTSWSTLQSESDCTKENLSPAALNSPVSAKPSMPIKPLRSAAKSSIPTKKGCEGEDGKVRDERKIDDEIEEIESEIKRLSSRLEALRLEKAERNATKTVENRGRIVPAKFMEPKQSVIAKKVEDTPKAKVNRRGMSLGPAEIFAAGGGRSWVPPGKADVNAITPVPATQSRRKSCFWKLQGIDEGKGVSERRKSLSLSPKSRRIAGRVHSIPGQKQAAATTTVGSRKCVKKEDGVFALIQPRKLFKEGEKSVPNKKQLKPGRVVASRYNQVANQSTGSSIAADVRKRSWPENDKEDDGKRRDKRRASSVGKSRGSNNNQGSEVRVKKRWEIPQGVVVYKKSEVEEEKSLLSSVANMSDVLLPTIRTLRCVNESPRDSGAAKRVAELTGKRSYFCPDEDVEASVCQVLSFAEEEADEEG